MFWDCSRAMAWYLSNTLSPSHPPTTHGWWVSGFHMSPSQPGQRLLLLKVSAPLSAKGVNEGALLLLAFLVPFLWESIHILLYFLHNNNSAAQGKFAQGKKKTMSANCGLFYSPENGWKLEECWDKSLLGAPCSCQHMGSAAGSSHAQLAWPRVTNPTLRKGT